MAYLSEEYSSSETLPQSGYELLPTGWYTATITQADLNDTKAGNGQYIKLRYDITGPTHQGRVVFGYLNVRNANSETEDIGRRQFADLRRSIGLTKVTDTDQLIGGHLCIKLEIRPERTDPTSGKTYGSQNVVKGFKSASSIPKATPAAKSAEPAPQVAPQAALAAAKSTPPWAKK